MAPSSPARAAASRANSRKSTGPKTAAGKARSCRNAVKHGLSGQGVGLLPEDQALVDHRIACWSEELGAVGDLESELVAAAASASVRRRRAEITEAQRAAERMRKAQARRLRRAEARLAEAEGTLASWDGAIAGYRAGGTLSHQAKAGIGGLVGEDADRPGPVLSHLIALQDRIGRWVSDADKAEARAMLWAELHRHRALALAVVEERREAVEEAATSDPADGWLDRTKTGDLLRRYHGAAERSFHRALAELNRTRRMPDSPVDDGARIEARSDDEEGACDERALESVPLPPPSRGRAGVGGPPGEEPSTLTLPRRGGGHTEGPPPASDTAPNEARTAHEPETSVDLSLPTLAEQRRAIGEALRAFLGPLAGPDLEDKDDSP